MTRGRPHQTGRGLLAILIAAIVYAAPAVAEDDNVLTAHLRRGVNILGYDGLWKGEIDNPFRMKDLARIREAGFDHVRVNFFGLRFMDSRGNLNEAVLERLDRVLDEAAKNNLWVVLDQHDNDDCNSDPQNCKEKLRAFWRGVTARYAGKRPSVAFEILNEPGWRMDYATWNDVVASALAEIRAKDPRRLVIVAALNNGDPSAVEKLVIPEKDKQLIVTVHYYEPMAFTHQGAPWNQEYKELHDVAWGAPSSRAKVLADLAPTAAWAEAHRRPVYLGEFGALDSAPPRSRAAWTRHVARTAESLGWGWAYWQFDHDFALTDPVTRAWRQPLLDALMK